MDFEQQPDSTTTFGNENNANDLISLGEDAPSKPTVDSPKKPEVFEPVSKKSESKNESECPVCGFLDHLEAAVPKPVHDVLVWKDVFKSAVICGTILPLLILYCYCNPLVVTAYILLGLTTCTFTYRVYRYILDSFQKSEIKHPFADFSDLDVDNCRHLVSETVDKALPVVVNGVNKVKHYILVQDVMETIKFAVAMYFIAVIGGFFSLRVLAILFFAGAFSLPKVYSMYKPQIREVFQKIHEQVGVGIKEVKAKIKSLRNPSESKKKN